MGAPSSREAHLSRKLPGRADLALGAPAQGIHQVSGTKLYLIRPPGSKSNIHSKSELRERLFWPGWMSSRAWPRATGNTLRSSPPSLLAHTDHPTFSVPAQEHCIRKLMLLSSWLEATKKSLRCCQLLYCHLIPQFRDVLCSWNAPCWRAIGSSKGRIRAVNSPGTDTAVAVQPQAHSGMPARVRQVPRQPGALGLAREPSSHSSARAGIQPQARPPRCPGERKGREKRKKNQSLKGTSTAELW